jgi:osmotically-inducible protein OsmY
MPNAVENAGEAIGPTPCEPGAAELERSIERLFVGNAKLDAEGLSVQVWNDGTVSLSGTVSSWAHHDAAVAAAWAVPGANTIVDQIRVEW